MVIGLHDGDARFRSKVYPSLPLMKLSAYHKKNGDHVSWFMPLKNYDVVYSSKVFTFHATDKFLPSDTIKGGIGYGSLSTLDDKIEHIFPDYSLYPTISASYGFTTRGCVNHCPWCVVPRKEGGLRPHAEIEEFLRKDCKNIVLMDNNILAIDHGTKQLEKTIKYKLVVDCNQGLDCRIAASDTAILKLLSKILWKRIRFACDTSAQIPYIEKAVKGIRCVGGKKYKFFVYCLVKDIGDALERVEFLRRLDVDCFAQPYIDFSNKVSVTEEQKRFARWVNRKEIFKSCTWKEYRYNMRSQ